MISIIHGLGPTSILEEIGDSADWSYKITVFYVDSALAEAEQVDRLRTFYQQIKSRIHQTMDMNVRYAFVFLPNGDLALINSYRKATKYIKIVELMIEEIEPILVATANSKFCLTMISVECPSYTVVKEQMSKLQAFSLIRILFGINKKWNLSDLIKNSSDDAIKLCHTILKLVKCYHERSHANYMNKVNELKTIFDAEVLFNEESIRKGISQFLFSTIQCQMNISDDSSEWIHKLKIHGRQLLNEIRKVERPQNVIEQTLLIIEKNFMHDISILQIADELELTPNYLSTLFHKKMGDTFIKYLTRLRLIKAQELLRDTHSQVQTVAEMVGYTNTRHFTRLFTEFTGCYPSVYKKSVCKKEELPSSFMEKEI
ncbi:helix-turn-helix transcriptional regulator [Paenibacillus sp. N3.4]|uniref:helix-turn-helix transcriptional regulator n=1 Tax=Paenibacillus sp. N3.4 TaxID=2603222 RepID=UPI0011CB2F6A|nr:AraC family transcriptional regulator [Paenibacillus sp. N3.4]TXK70156.1 helix-turn-helix transcriptional regulator [Paenibacillus sp. N3.4]